MKKIHVPRCRINENPFIIDFTPTEDAANNRFGLNSEKTVTLLAIALQHLLVLTCRNCRNCQKIFIDLRCYKMKKIHVPRCRINENLFIIDFTPTEDTADNRFGLNSEKKTTSRQSLFLSDLWPGSDSSAAWCKLWKQTGTFGIGALRDISAPGSFIFEPSQWWIVQFCKISVLDSVSTCCKSWLGTFKSTVKY